MVEGTRPTVHVEKFFYFLFILLPIRVRVIKITWSHIHLTLLQKFHFINWKYSFYFKKFSGYFWWLRLNSLFNFFSSLRINRDFTCLKIKLLSIVMFAAVLNHESEKRFFTVRSRRIHVCWTTTAYFCFQSCCLVAKISGTVIKVSFAENTTFLSRSWKDSLNEPLNVFPWVIQCGNSN